MHSWPRKVFGFLDENLLVLSGLLGGISFLLAVLARPPLFIVVLALSLPFFAALFRCRWRDCIAWIIITFPFQFYFDLGSISLTHSELYLFLFAVVYSLARLIPDRSFAFPSLLAPGVAYGLASFLPALTGNPSLVKEGVRTLTEVFFCPRPSRNGLPARNCIAFFPD